MTFTLVFSIVFYCMYPLRPALDARALLPAIDRLSALARNTRDLVRDIVLRGSYRQVQSPR
jgi:hypothetical protein